MDVTNISGVANVVVDTQNSTTTTQNAAPASSNPPNQSALKVIPTVEAAHADTAVIMPRTCDEYVNLFRKHEEKTALATLELCRVVYEAFRSLSEADFNAFCGNVGYKDTSSTIRKFLAIGKVAPRLVQYADRMPSNWTSIYMLTQIPAQMFEKMVEQGRVFKAIKTKDISELVKQTRDISRIEAYLPRDKKTADWKVATVYFTLSSIDDIDWSAMTKALAEIERRLPLRIEIDAGAQSVWQQRKGQIYENAKVRFDNEALRPDVWDFGREANNVARSQVPSEAQPDAAEAPVSKSVGNTVN